MSSAELKKAKRDVRRRVLALRDATSPSERAAAAAAVAVRCMDLPEVTRARVAMVFWSFGSEVPTMPIIERLGGAGKVVALPRIVGGDLQARTWRPGEPMSETRFGALEPEDGEVVPPADVDVVFTPAVAFDLQGRRVGYGGGFYDRFFARTAAARIGVCLALQVLDEPLPAGHFDLRVQTIVTEGTTIRIGNPPSR